MVTKGWSPLRQSDSPVWKGPPGLCLARYKDSEAATKHPHGHGEAEISVRSSAREGVLLDQLVPAARSGEWDDDSGQAVLPPTGHSFPSLNFWPGTCALIRRADGDCRRGRNQQG